MSVEVKSAIKTNISPKKNTKMQDFKKNVKRDKYLLILILPVVVYFIIFHYVPMYGITMAFKNYSISKGILHSPWAGLKYFKMFFNSFYFGRILKNTLIISIKSLLWGFPLPIIFALMLNEFKDGFFKKSIQTVSYLPHFVSMVVVVGMMVNFLSPTNGVVNMFLKSLGKNPIDFMHEASWFRPLYIGSGVWQSFGWDSIIYLAALSGIDVSLYEAAKVDGANKWQQLIHITLPGIAPTIIILLILSIGGIMSVGFEKIILMYNPATYETADVISTFVYRRGILSSDYSFGAAVGLFNSVINLILLVTANYLSKKWSEISLW